jgi:hypothetical protein
MLRMLLQMLPVLFQMLRMLLQMLRVLFQMLRMPVLVQTTELVGIHSTCTRTAASSSWSKWEVLAPDPRVGGAQSPSILATPLKRAALFGSKAAIWGWAAARAPFAAPRCQQVLARAVTGQSPLSTWSSRLPLGLRLLDRARSSKHSRRCEQCAHANNAMWQLKNRTTGI